MNKPPPGLLPQQANPEVIMMICTAGHVDHGKTLLVKLLTGCSTDCLKEEQERGMTIELGYAPCFLGNNLCIGIVDVPGHEKFVKTMVAGVSGIGLTILVIAADDGIMPQTVEHLQIMELLGVRNGIIALTKIDLVSPERLQQCQEEIREFVKGTFLAESPICPVSSKSFDGYPEFYETLTSRIQVAVQKRCTGVFRMPIEDIYAFSGQGTVITGIPIDGELKVGDQVELVPGNQIGKVRGIQRFSRDASCGGQGQCLAINLPDFNKTPPERGQVLTQTGYLKPTVCIMVYLKAVPGLKKPIQNAEEIKFHAGTSEINGKIYLLEGQEYVAGQEGYATLALNSPAAVTAHDRFILRRPSPASTVAGGEVLMISSSAERPRKAQILPVLQAKREFFMGIDPQSESGFLRRILWWLGHEQKIGGSRDAIAKGVMIRTEEIQQYVKILVQEGKLIALGDDFYIHPTAYEDFYRSVETQIRKAASNTLSLAIAELRQNNPWPSLVWARIEIDLEKNNVIQRRGGKIVIANAVVRLPLEEQALMERILKIYEETAFHSPRPEELPDLAKATLPKIAKIMDYLYQEKKLIKISPLVVLSYSHFKKAQDMVVSIIREKGILNSADFKYNLDTTRKYALAVLDFLDARRVTVRSGNDRKLTMDYAKNLM